MNDLFIGLIKGLKSPDYKEIWLRDLGGIESSFNHKGFVSIPVKHRHKKGKVAHEIL